MGRASPRALLLSRRHITRDASGTSAQLAVVPASSQRQARAELFAVNVGLSAITSGVVSLARHGSFRRGLLGGAAGGGLGFLGKLVAVDPSVGAPFIGRQIGAIGASMTRSAALGDGFLEQIVLPVGPLRVYLNLEDAETTTVRVDLESVAWTAYGLLTDRTRIRVGGRRTAPPTRSARARSMGRWACWPRRRPRSWSTWAIRTVHSVRERRIPFGANQRTT